MQQLALAIFISLLAHTAFSGTVRCECPEVNAKGTGDSSCTATETGGECTIDFNTFNLADEEQAFTLLKEVTSVKGVVWTRFNQYPGLTFQRAQGLEDRELVDLLMVYVLVSGVQGRTGLGHMPIGDIHSALSENRGRVVQAFVGEDIKLIHGAGPHPQILVSNGCIEVGGPWEQYWAMFKAYWSSAASEPRCAGSGGQ